MTCKFSIFFLIKGKKMKPMAKTEKDIYGNIEESSHKGELL
jgi:hypothetical protein